MQVTTFLVIAASLVTLVTSSPLTFVSSTYNSLPTPTTTISAHAGCDVVFTSEGYTTTVPFEDCPLTSVSAPPGFPPRPNEGCTTYNGERYCARGNCDANYVSYYHTSVWSTSCSTDGCSFITDGPSIGFDCATTKTLDDGCLEIQSRDWDAIHITTTCPNNTTPTYPCGVTSFEEEGTPYTFTTCEPSAIIRGDCSIDGTIVGTRTLDVLKCYITNPPPPTDPPIICQLETLVSDDITLTSMSCNYIPDDCSTSTSLNVHNRTVTYFVCPTTTIEPLPPGVTTTTICPHSKCHSPPGGGNNGGGNNGGNNGGGHGGGHGDGNNGGGDHGGDHSGGDNDGGNNGGGNNGGGNNGGDNNGGNCPPQSTITVTLAQETKTETKIITEYKTKTVEKPSKPTKPPHGHHDHTVTETCYIYESIITYPYTTITSSYTITVKPTNTETSTTTDPNETPDTSDSTDLSETAEPTESVEPTESPEPTDSTEPTESTKPTDSTRSTEPTEPTETLKPTEPTESTEPVESTEPILSTDPTDPTKPTDPTETPDPTQPTVTILPAKSTTLSN
ncbi:putative adhesin-like protein [Candida albicans P57055]|nr:putative adhesin-like protein [Candida albicans P57055]